MSRSGVWPSRDDYQAAVMQPAGSLGDARLRACRVETTTLIGGVEMPAPRSGNFGAVYKFAGTGPTYALKVFDKGQPDRQQRYRLIDEHLAAGRPPGLVSFAYREDGVRVQGQWYPALVMEWAEGEQLDRYLAAAAARGRGVDPALCAAWVDLVLGLRARKVAHGDLQHGNILVTGAGLRLVDYDGMFVPAMRPAGLTAAEIGLPAYQHPKRFRGYFDERLDDFSALVILLTLAAADADAWKRYHTDDNSLLITEADLLRPDQSSLMAALASSPRRGVRKLTALLRRAAASGLDEIPAFGDIAADAAVRELWGGAGRLIPAAVIADPLPAAPPPPPDLAALLRGAAAGGAGRLIPAGAIADLLPALPPPPPDRTPPPPPPRRREQDPAPPPAAPTVSPVTRTIAQFVVAVWGLASFFVALMILVAVARELPVVSKVWIGLPLLLLGTAGLAYSGNWLVYRATGVNVFAEDRKAKKGQAGKAADSSRPVVRSKDRAE